MARDAPGRDPQAGFTLIEVLAAVVILSIVGVMVSSMVSELTRHLGRSRQEHVAAAAAEAHARALLAELRDGELPEPGVSEGRFEGDHDDLVWELEVDPYAVPLPEERAEDRVVSSVFTEPSTRARLEQPSVRRLVLRVFREDPSLGDERVEATEPFVLFAVEQLTAEELAEAAARDEELELEELEE